MPEQSDIDRRLRAVERALTDADHDVAGLEDAAAIADRLDALEARIADLEERTTELDAANQAVRGYVGNVRSVNEVVEDRADAAIAAVDRIEARLDGTATHVDHHRASGETGRSSAGGSESSNVGDSKVTPEATPTAHASQQKSTATNHDDSATRSPKCCEPGTAAGDEYGIEMPAPGAHSSVDAESSSADDERSVIERVREAL